MGSNSVRDALSRASLLESEGKAGDALTYLSKFYNKHKIKRVLGRLIDLSIKTGDNKSAEAYLGEFMVKYSGDSDAAIFNYRLDKLENKADAILIKDLLKIKDNSYEDKYAYELALLYDKCGDKENRDRVCSEIISLGTEADYIKKAGVLAGMSAVDIAVSGSDKEEPYSESEAESDEINSDDVSIINDEKELEKAEEKLNRAYELIDSNICENNDSVSDINDVSDELPPDIDNTMKPHFLYALKLIKDADYIVTSESLAKIKELISGIINDPLAATISLDDVNKIIGERIKQVINKADERGMSELSDVVLNRRYENNALVSLTESDFD